jgi:hypothetical protein
MDSSIIGPSPVFRLKFRAESAASLPHLSWSKNPPTEIEEIGHGGTRNPVSRQYIKYPKRLKESCSTRAQLKVLGIAESRASI